MRQRSVGFGILGLLVALSLLLSASEAAAASIVPVSQTRAVFTNLLGYGPVTVISPDDTASGFGAFSGYSSKTAQLDNSLTGYRSGTVIASEIAAIGPASISLQASTSLDLTHIPVNPLDDTSDFAVAQFSYSLDFHLASDSAFSVHVFQTLGGTPAPIGLSLSASGSLLQGFMSSNPSFLQTGILPAGDYHLELTETQTHTTYDNYVEGPRHLQQSASVDVLLAIPEPTTALLLILGLLGLTACTRVHPAPRIDRPGIIR